MYTLCTLKTEHCSLFLQLLGFDNTLSLLRSSFRLISISQLNTLLHLHLGPINVIVYDVPGVEILSQGEFHA